MTLSDKLRGSSLFYDMTNKEIDFLVKDSNVLEFQNGDRIFKEGDPIKSLYIILDGKACLYRNMNYELLEIQTLKNMDYFGEQVFGTGNESMFEVLAQTYVHCLEIPFERFQLFYQKFPEAYAIFVNNLLREELDKKNVALGLIARVHRDKKTLIGLPVFGQRKLSAQEIYTKYVQNKKVS